jgi:uncharacterized repeat protein (TIGR03803 family)
MICFQSDSRISMLKALPLAVFVLVTLAAAQPAQAQTYTVLHDFTGGVDGAFPHQIIQGSDGNFYGTATNGGAKNHGDIFAISPSGVFNVLYSFTGGADGCQPEGPVFRDSNGDIYGTTHECGDPKCRCGVIFKLDTNNILTVLHTFTRETETEGVFPSNNIVSVKGELYGATESGVLYKITKKGHYTVIHAFGSQTTLSTQSDLIRDSAGNIYGDTYYSIYKLDTAGNFSVLYTFAGGAKDGQGLAGRVILGSSGTITGANQFTPASQPGCGLIFRLEVDGTVKVLHRFHDGADGCSPQTGLIDIGGTIYGTADFGGDISCDTEDGGCGVLFQISKNGVYSVVHTFSGPDGALIQDELTKGNDGSIYGASKVGGSVAACDDFPVSGCGVIRKYTPASE